MLLNSLPNWASGALDPERTSVDDLVATVEKFGSFPEPVMRMYTKQLLIGLEYLHKNGIMHRDIKHLDESGVSFCTRTTYEDTAIKNAVDIL
nr:mitogen-activated protein kinase kinase kinase 3 [Ipomoea batatas]